MFFQKKSAPARGTREPIIRYQVDDPLMDDLERFREIFCASPKSNLNQIYLQALLIGARMMLNMVDGSQAANPVRETLKKTSFRYPYIDIHPGVHPDNRPIDLATNPSDHSCDRSFDRSLDGHIDVNINLSVE